MTSKSSAVRVSDTPNSTSTTTYSSASNRRLPPVSPSAHALSRQATPSPADNERLPPLPTPAPSAGVCPPGPWDQLVASLLAQHTALLHKLANSSPGGGGGSDANGPTGRNGAVTDGAFSVVPLAQSLLVSTTQALAPLRQPATAIQRTQLGRRNWRNRRNRQRKKMRRLFNAYGFGHVPPAAAPLAFSNAAPRPGVPAASSSSSCSSSASTFASSSSATSSMSANASETQTTTTTTHIRKTLRSVVSVRETHAVAEAQQEKNARLKEAFGISEFFVEGSSLDPNRKAKEEAEAAAAAAAKAAAAAAAAAAAKATAAPAAKGDREGRKYGWVRTPSPSPERSRDKKERKEKKKKKKRSRDRSSSEESRSKRHKSKKSKRSRLSFTRVKCKE